MRRRVLLMVKATVDVPFGLVTILGELMSIHLVSVVMAPAGALEPAEV